VAAPPRDRPWGLTDVVLGYAVGLLGAGLLAGALLGGYVDTPWASPGAALGWAAGSLAAGVAATPPHLAPLALQALAGVGLWLGLAGAPVLAARRTRHPIAPATPTGRGTLASEFGFSFRARDALLGLPIGVAMQLVVIPVLYLPFRGLIDEIDVEQPARELVARANGVGIVVLILTVVVGAPLVEELFFRGLMLRTAQRAMSPAAAIELTAVLFGLTHFQKVQLPALVLFGAVLGFLAWRTGRLGPSVFAHVGFNLTTVLVLLQQR
jgi:membrane protease YdiL (CAAX protease family)